VLFRRRELVVGMKEAGLPSMVSWAIGRDAIVLAELTVVSLQQRACIVLLRTQADVSVGRLQDQGLYYADPADPARTVFVHCMDLQSTGSMMVSKLIQSLQPKAGEPAPAPPAALAGPHIAALYGRLKEMFGDEA
jgi:hypothetical protein